MNRKTDTTNSMVRHAIHSSRGCSSTFTGGNRLLNRSVINVIPYQLEWYRPLTAKLFPEPDIATNSEKDWWIISNVPREPGEPKIKLPRRCPSCVQNLPQTKRQPPNLHTNRTTSAPCASTNHHAELGFIVPRETLLQPTNVDSSQRHHDELRLHRAKRNLPSARPTVKNGVKYQGTTKINDPS